MLFETAYTTFEPNTSQQHEDHQIRINSLRVIVRHLSNYSIRIWPINEIGLEAREFPDHQDDMLFKT